MGGDERSSVFTDPFQRCASKCARSGAWAVSKGGNRHLNSGKGFAVRPEKGHTGRTFRLLPERRNMNSENTATANPRLFPLKPFALFGLLGLLSACSALFPPNYRPYSNQVGYSDAHVAKDRYEVSYAGPAEFTEIQAKKMAIVRAAELARSAGTRWFRIVADEASSRKMQVLFTEVSRKPLHDSDLARPGAPQVVKEKTTRSEAWIPLVHLVIELEQAESEETLDADAVIREARTSGILPK
jgi:hypothetical protein